jgi:hypothetical protein
MLLASPWHIGVVARLLYPDTVTRTQPDEFLELPRPTGPMRFFSKAGLPYPVVTAALLGAWMLVAGIFNGLTGEFGQAMSGDQVGRLFLDEMLQGAMTAYLLTCEYVARRAVARDFEQLHREVEHPEDAFPEIVRRAFHETRLDGWRNVLIALIACIAMVELDPAIWTEQIKPEPTSLLYIWAVLRNTIMGWAAVRLATAEIRWTRSYVDIARHLHVPLPRGAISQPFVRKGMHSAAIWLVFSSLFSLFWLGNSAGTFNPLLFGVTLAFATYALFVPLGAFRATVRLAKKNAFERVDREIEAERDPLLEARATDSSRLASLVAWRNLVERVDEWPLSAPAALRFALFVLLGLGSWLGSALVELGVDAFLK